MAKKYGLEFNDQPYINLNGYIIWYKNSGIISLEEINFAYYQIKNRMINIPKL